MIGTTSVLPPLDEAARLRANPAASWGAILAGTVVAVALSLVLFTLGAGLGFASISPSSGRGLSVGSFTIAGTIWLIVTQWLSAAAGGYLTGRLRHRWLATHTHEVFFRDSAHALVTGAAATLLVAAVLAGSATALLGGGAKAIGGAAALGSQAHAAMGHEMPGAGDRGPGPAGEPLYVYNVDKLFRSNSTSNSSGNPSANGPEKLSGNDARSEVMHMAAISTVNDGISEDDRTYLANLVAARTGVANDEAQKRVDAFIQSLKDAKEKAKAAADQARKAAATAALYAALALLIGAFIASVAAAIGGRLRDEHM